MYTHWPILNKHLALDFWFAHYQFQFVNFHTMLLATFFEDSCVLRGWQNLKYNKLVKFWDFLESFEIWEFHKVLRALLSVLRGFIQHVLCLYILLQWSRFLLFISSVSLVVFHWNTLKIWTAPIIFQFSKSSASDAMFYWLATLCAGLE